MVKFYKAEKKWLKDWITQASDDLRTERDYIDKDEDYARKNVCYHSHQAIEKFLKAYLIAKKVDYPDSHNLERLQAMCEELDNTFREIKPLNLRKLTGFAMDARYPQHEYERKRISSNDVKEAFNAAVKINKFVTERIKKILSGN